MPYMRSPNFDKLMPRRGLQRLSDDLLMRRMLRRSVVSDTNSYEGVPCREYTGAQRGGYGRMWDGQKSADTHVLSCQINKGPTPPGHQVLHRCGNPACFEPAHLWTGTVGDNMADRESESRGGSHKRKGRRRGPSPKRGAKHVSAKLSEAQAKAIKRLGSGRAVEEAFRKPGGGVNLSAVARRFNVSDSLVRGIVSGRNWAWLQV